MKPSRRCLCPVCILPSLALLLQHLLPSACTQLQVARHVLHLFIFFLPASLIRHLHASICGTCVSGGGAGGHV